MGGLRTHAGRLASGSTGAAGLVLYLTSPALTSPLTPLAIVLLWLSAWISGPSMPRPGVLVGLAVIALSAALTVPLAWHSGSSPAPTVWLAVLTLALAPLAWHRRPSTIWPWLAPPALAHAALAVWQGAVEGMGRAPGLAQNQNAAAAFLALAVIYLSTTRYRYLTLPLLVGVAYTGSRWTTLCLALILVGMFLARCVSWRWLAPAMAATVLLTSGAQPLHLAAAYRVVHGSPSDSGDSGSAAQDLRNNGSRVWSDAQIRLQADWPSLMPRGFYPPSTPVSPHNVPLRMALETGLLSGLAWVVLTGGALWRRPRLGVEWWMLLAVAAFSMMYYHTWIGPLGGFWWLLVAERLAVNRGRVLPVANPPHCGAGDAATVEKERQPHHTYHSGHEP